MQISSSNLSFVCFCVCAACIGVCKSLFLKSFLLLKYIDLLEAWKCNFLLRNYDRPTNPKTNKRVNWEVAIQRIFIVFNVCVWL